MKNEIEIEVPIDVNYLSNWNDFDSRLPKGKVILNKNICGCGCTEYYLRNEQPIILVSPRKELLNCKMNSKRERPLFYFDRSKSKKIKAEDTIKALQAYLCNPFEETDFVPKVLVTYDSLKLVIDTITNMGYIDLFTIVVDEFTCIFTDVMLKGTLELNLIQMLNSMPNHTVFISATPVQRNYLEELVEFKDMPYASLIWDESRYETVRIAYQKMINTRTAISKIIEDYRKNGYFQAKIVDGQKVYSQEAVFFLNCVTDIAAVITSCGLTPDDTLVICADDQKNKNNLRKVGFTIGHVPNESEYRRKNKTYTFVTKASFEGTDFYSDTSSTFVFADSNRDNLCLDISIDLPQIVGRCRTKWNPFRKEIMYYYKTSDSEHFDLDDAKQRISKKMDETNKLLDIYRGIENANALRKLSTAQVVDKYKEDYVDVQFYQDGTACAVCNKLAWVADLRAIEIKSMQYQTTYSVLAYLEGNGFEPASYHAEDTGEIGTFYNEFIRDANFQRRMKLYIDTLEAVPSLKSQIESMADVPLKYKDYYNILGPDKIKSLCYREKDLASEVRCMQTIEKISEMAESRFVRGHNYSNAQVKEILEGIYQELSLKKAPKATYLPKLIEAELIKFTDADGKRQNGYRIL